MRDTRLVCPILVSMVVFTFADEVRTDAGPPQPSLDLTFLFQNLDEFPKYDFYLKYERLGPIKVHLGKVKSGTPIHVGGRRQGLSPIFLIAVPRGQELAVPEKREKDWLSNAPIGGLQSQPLKGDDTGSPASAYNGYDITYRVRIEGDRLEVDWIESNLNDWWSNARRIAILIGAACVLIPGGVIVLVVLLIVRWNRRPAERTKDEG